MADHIILFRDANFHGAHKHVCDNETNLNASDDSSFNDNVSSIVVLTGNWKFFRNSGFNDEYPVVLGPGLYRFVGSFGIDNDDMSSLTTVADPPTASGEPLDAHVILFEHANFHGGHCHVFTRETNLADNGFNDVTSSIVVEQGHWSFFRNAGFDAGYPPVIGLGIYPSVEDVGIGNDAISSLEPTTSPSTINNSVDNEVLLFEHANFHGAHKHVAAAESNLNADDDSFFNDAVSSLIVLEGTWSFFADADFLSPYPASLGPGAYSSVADQSITNDDMSSLSPTIVDDSFQIEHVYVDTDEPVTVFKVNDVKRVKYAAAGDFLIRHPGALNIFTYAVYYIHIKGDLIPDGGTHTPRPQTEPKTLPVSVRIFSPDGLEFTASHVTLDDLNRFRDLRSVSQGTWHYEASGLSDPIFVPDEDGSVSPGDAYIRIALVERLPSRSAAPLVNSPVTSTGLQTYSFDLFRVGGFEAYVDQKFTWSGTLSLKDPDGVVVASSASRLDYPVTLQTIDQSRTAAGDVRPWSLDVDTTSALGIGGVVKATVIATTRIPVATLQDRIDFLIGTNGSKLSIYGENKNGRALGRIVILDPYSAETIDMQRLLDDVLKKAQQDPGVDISTIEPNVVYNVANRSESLSYGLSLDVSSLKVTAIKIAVGGSQNIHPSIPAVTVEVDVQGQIAVNLGPFELASVSLNDDRITLEAGARLNGFGSIATVSWIDDDAIDIDISWEAAVAAGLIVGAIAELGLVGLKEYIEHEVNDAIVQRFRSIVEGAILQAPRIMAMLLGANFTLRSFRIENGAIVIDYVAPIEPDPRPSPTYTGVIGRGLIALGPGLWQLFPRSLGDTWAADNLAKIEHIVVVMMENRSFNHVLGYRGLLADAQGENGWSDELIGFLTMSGFPIRKLSDSAIVPNAANLKTRFPVSVGHSLADVAQQLSERLQAPSGVTINSPKGFEDRFQSRIGSSGLAIEDVLGYYTGTDLPFYRFLADNYAYCERYFSAHPGPTLPNRMYSLSGDVQYDRTGEAILDNNNADNLALSRGLSIFDLLTRKKVSWRVYESFPSITMLRMFARYAADDTNIVPINRLEQDIAGFNLPAVTFIDPAMHHAPENDDHSPFADMLDGQIFIKRVYDALQSNEALWPVTLLIVTYDEHGGFYDHVVPPVADALSLPPVFTDGGPPGPPAPFKADMTIPYGVRVPTFVVSPLVPAGKGPDVPLDHCSILKTILARFCGQDRPFLSDRVHASHTFDAFLTGMPRMARTLRSPALTEAAVRPTRRSVARGIRTPPMSRKTMQTGDVDFRDVTGMLARMLGRY